MRARPILVALAAIAILLGTAFAAVASQPDGETTATGTSLKGVDGSRHDKAPVSEPTAVPTVSAVELGTTATEVAETTSAVVDEVVSDEAVSDEAVSDEAVEDEGSESARSDEAATTDDDETEGEEAVEPNFTIDDPVDGTTVTTKMVIFSGTADEGVIVKRGKYEATMDGTTWSIELKLRPGSNEVTFKGIGLDGEYTTATVTVIYDAPEGEVGDDASRCGRFGDGSDVKARNGWSHRDKGDDGEEGNVEASNARRAGNSSKTDGRHHRHHRNRDH